MREGNKIQVKLHNILIDQKKDKFLPLESLHSLEEEMNNEINLLKVVINAKKERNRIMS